MISDTEKSLMLENMIPTLLDESLDKAFVAGVCRTTAEEKMQAISIPINHISFAWSCLEYHSISIMTRIEIDSDSIERSIHDITKAVNSGVHFCELVLNESFFTNQNFLSNLKSLKNIIINSIPLGKIIFAIPYYALNTREKTILFLKAFSHYGGISLRQDGLSETEKLTSVYRLFDSIQNSEQIPKWFIFDLFNIKNTVFFTQNILRLRDKILHGLNLKISFHVSKKQLSLFTNRRT